MAWRSSGTTNEEMVDNLKRFGVIRSTRVEAAFRDVDRAHFCPRNLVDMAYSDQPLREGDIHLSAPHMYGAIVEHLDLTGSTGNALEHNEEDEVGSAYHGATSMSFLNVGSGTGYLSCIVARLLSKSSVLYGIELQRDVLDHCLASMARWKAAMTATAATTATTTTTTTTNVAALPHMEFVHGNGLHIDATKGESIVGYDRIYVGSSIDQRAVAKLTSMLRLGGILIAPVDDELIKVVRIKQTKSTSGSINGNTRSNNVWNQVDSLSDDFTKEVISAVRFAALAKRPRTVAIVPSRVWGPQIHQSFPRSFQKVCKTILLCSNAAQIQPLEPQPPLARRLNAASKLPKNLWMEIISYTHHSWFEPQTDMLSVGMLRQRLQQEQANAVRAAATVRQAEQRIRALERERDGYRLLALRWQSRFQELAAAAAGAAAAQQFQGGGGTVVTSATFTRLMETMLNEPPTLDDDDDNFSLDHADHVEHGAMDSSDDEEQYEEGNNDDEDASSTSTRHSDHANDDEDSSIFLHDGDGEEAHDVHDNNDDDDDFSVHMELSVSSEPAMTTTGTASRAARAVSITSELSP